LPLCDDLSGFALQIWESLVNDSALRPTLRFINVGHAFAHLLMLLFPTAVLAMEGMWGLGYAELLPLGFAGYLLFGLGSLPAGWLGDRWSSGWLMAIFFLGSGAACVLAGLATGPWTLAAGLTLIGLFASIYHPVAIAWLVGAGDRPGRTLGFNGVFGAVGTGGAALVAGVLADLIDWRAAFIVPGLVCLAIGVAFTLGVARGRHGMVRARYRPDRVRPDAAEGRRGLFLMLGVILFSGMIFQMASVGMPKIFQARLGDVIGTGALAAGTLVSLVYGISALGQIAGGVLADRYDERTLYPISYVFQVGILIIAALSFSPGLVVVMALAVTVQTGTQPIENCLMARYTPETWRATVYGLKFVLALGLSSLGVPLIALIVGLTGSVDGVFMALIACGVVALGIALTLPRGASREAVPAIQPAE
jgi:MFS family permease